MSANNRKAHPEVVPPQVIHAKELAQMLSISLRTVRRLDSAGKIPRPVRVGSTAIRWRLEEIKNWILAGCPDRRQWEAEKSDRLALLRSLR